MICRQVYSWQCPIGDPVRLSAPVASARNASIGTGWRRRTARPALAQLCPSFTSKPVPIWILGDPERVGQLFGGVWGWLGVRQLIGRWRATHQHRLQHRFGGTVVEARPRTDHEGYPHRFSASDSADFRAVSCAAPRSGWVFTRWPIRCSGPVGYWSLIVSWWRTL
jgi:hypothetical protein